MKTLLFFLLLVTSLARCAVTVTPGGGSGGSGSGTATTNYVNNASTSLNVTNAGVVADGVTDVTTNLQALLNRGGTFDFGSGIYLMQEMKPTNNCRITSTGARFIYKGGASNTNIFWSMGLNTNVTFENITFDGRGSPGNLSNATFTTYDGVHTISASPELVGYWNWYGLRHGVQINTDNGSAFRNCHVRGFSGIGVIPISASGSQAYVNRTMDLSGISCQSNFCGLFASATLQQTFASFILQWVTNYVPGALNPEYTAFKNIHCYQNVIGMIGSVGNHMITDCQFDANYIGLGMWGGANSDHGTIGLCNFNHPLDTGHYMYLAAVSAGEIITGCEFLGGGTVTFTLNNCKGVNVNNSQFNPCTISVFNSPGPANEFNDNTYAGTWASYTKSVDSGFKFSGNISYDTVGDSDGSPAALTKLNGYLTDGGTSRLAAVSTTNSFNTNVFAARGVFNTTVFATNGTTNGPIAIGLNSGGIQLTNAGGTAANLSASNFTGDGIFLSGASGRPQFTIAGSTNYGMRVFSDRVDFWIGGLIPLTVNSAGIDLAAGTTYSVKWGANALLSNPSAGEVNVGTTASSPNGLLRAGNLVSTNLVVATNGLASYSTNRLIIGPTGITNTRNCNLRILGFTGTTVTQKQPGGLDVAWGNITTPILMLLQPGESLVGTSCGCFDTRDF